jgi:hypothetical protein
MAPGYFFKSFFRTVKYFLYNRYKRSFYFGFIIGLCVIVATVTVVVVLKGKVNHLE